MAISRTAVPGASPGARMKVATPRFMSTSFSVTALFLLSYSILVGPAECSVKSSRTEAYMTTSCCMA